jgi:hypothetical protein
VGRNARIKGFRPGKVPTKVIEQRFGGQIRNEALSDMIGSSFQEAIVQEKLRPAMQPSIATTGRPENGEIEYTATFEVLPEIGKLDVSSLEIVKPVATVADADIDQMIETLRLQRRSWTQVERAAQEGDMVLFEYSAEGADFRHPASGTDRVGASSAPAPIRRNSKTRSSAMSQATSSRRRSTSRRTCARRRWPARAPTSRSSSCACRNPSCRTSTTHSSPVSA